MSSGAPPSAPVVVAASDLEVGASPSESEAHAPKSEPGAFLNVVVTKAGKVRAVCQFCGRQTAAHDGHGRSRVSILDLPAGWSMAPYPDDFAQPDGSTGTTYTCSDHRNGPYPLVPLVPRGGARIRRDT